MDGADWVWTLRLGFCIAVAVLYLRRRLQERRRANRPAPVRDVEAPVASSPHLTLMPPDLHRRLVSGVLARLDRWEAVSGIPVYPVRVPPPRPPEDPPLLPAGVAEEMARRVAARLDDLARGWGLPPPLASFRRDPTFRFRALPNGTWRVYLDTLPPWEPLLRGWAPLSHLLGDEQGPFVCWSEPIASEADARAIAALWVENTRRHLFAGVPF